MLDLIGKSISRIGKKYIFKYVKKLRKLTNVKKYVKKVGKVVKQKISSFISFKPKSVKDYVRFGQTYIAKKFLIIAVVVVLLLVFVVSKYVYPWMEGRFWSPTIVVNTEKFYSYSGQAKVVTAQDELLYFGEVRNGNITGQGNLYDKAEEKDTELVYSGGFKNSEYHGDGEKFDGKNNLIYKGEFASNEYEGKGKLYSSGGMLKYEGTFKNGEFDGDGRYYQNGELVYDGDFKNGAYSGTGSLYYKNGNLKYRGTFQSGEMYGEGKLFDENGSLIYEGTFLDGMYDGIGTEYDPKTKNLIYEGQFKKDEYHGSGKLYDTDSGRLIYEGGFKDSLYSGEGTLYNGKGKVIYTGTFYEGQIDYLQYANSEAEEVREAFKEEDETLMLENHFIMFYKDLKVAFAMTYADVEEPQVMRMILFGDQELLSVNNSMDLEELKDEHGEPFSNIFYTVSDENAAVIDYLEVEEDAIGRLYGLKYLFEEEDLFLRCYFLDTEDEMAYYEVGGI